MDILRFQIFFLISFFSTISFSQEIRTSRDYFILEKKAAEGYSKFGLIPGVYLNQNGLGERQDLNNLVHGSVWKNMYTAGADITIGLAPGTIPETEKEVWALYRGHSYLLVSQAVVPQIVLQAVPRLIFPAKGGFFAINKKFQPSFNSNEVKVVVADISTLPYNAKSEAAEIFRDKDEKINSDHYNLTSDNLGFIYLTSDKKIALYRNDGKYQILEISVEEDVAITREGVYTSKTDLLSRKKHIQFTSLKPDGSVKETTKTIYSLKEGETYRFKSSEVSVAIPRSTGGSYKVNIGPTGMLSEIGGKEKFQAPSSANLDSLRGVGQDLRAKSELGVYNGIVDRLEFYRRITQGLRKNNNTWVNLVGPLGSGASSIAFGYARGIHRGLAEMTDLADYEVYSVSMGKLIKQDSIDKNNAGITEVTNFIGAAQKKKVILIIDEFLDDATLGSTNAKQSLESFLRFFRPTLEAGEIKIITTSNSAQWEELAQANPQLKALANTVEVGQPSVGILKAIMQSQRVKLEKALNVQILPEVVSLVLTMSPQISPAEVEPKRSVDLLTEIAVGYGSPNAKNITTITEQSASSFLVTKTLNLKDLKVDIKALDAFLKTELIGQEEARNIIVKNLSPLSMGYVDLENGPLATLFLMGPTGVGKTFSSQLLAKHLGLPLVRVNMQYFNGFGADQAYTKEIKRYENKPFVLLLDEMDKPSDRSVTPKDRFLKLRTVLETGIWGEGTDERINLKTAILVMTSNHAQDLILSNEGKSHSELLALVQAYVLETDPKKTPENEQISQNVWSYLESRVAIYKPLPRTELYLVARKFARELSDKIQKQKGVKVEVSPRLIENTVEMSYKDKLGVVPIRSRIFENLSTVVISYLEDQLRSGVTGMNEVYVTVAGNGDAVLINNKMKDYEVLKSQDQAKVAKRK
ncbi:MAG: hypothetical protein A4S09_02100 [Proteobacteria bacterium SG_bin7]|nr:MAG: hypothetical protein A4S09_02100 [Proteobacteria bacterium SG_bin7]